ncbi:acyltransferase family protein [Adhaeribacter aquaticus]|uniref:acyltransferase family protein n=1 Tax=Adhaeribacter aquaticus TaxID=299567 RepID=UPI00047E2408|nr:acyltransferase [Adhaeribacter aquaticus]
MLLSPSPPKLESTTIREIQKDNTFQHIASFDGIRGFAAFLVLLHHGSYGFFHGGWIGVDLFFVLSGYLITSLLQNEYNTTGKISISKFYARRALRLLPPLLLVVLLANIFWPYTSHYPGADQSTATLSALLYFLNFIPDKVAGNLTHIWSLSVEEHFYLVWPFIAAWFFFKTSRRNRILFLSALILAGVAFRIYAFNSEIQLLNGLITVDAYRFTLCRIDGILLGVLLSVILNKPKYKNTTLPNTTATLFLAGLFIFFITILVAVGETNLYWRNGGFILTNIICAFTVFIAVKKPNHSFLTNKVLRWLGKRSYGIYMYHFPIFLVLENLREPGNVSNLLTVTLLRFVASIVAAELSYRYLEQPILKLKKRYEVNKPEVAKAI